VASPLQDLDELVLLCRDLKAKQYIQEAVASYKAGAHRAAIVATWIAVCFDFIEKIRELALAGDKEAELQVKELDRIRREDDLQGALKFERQLLTQARDKFELISPLECTDLERLQTDRNRCAHPSLTADDQAYTPSAELARLHIHSAVTHVLQHPPVQGKYALDRLLGEVVSEYFPRTTEDALVALGSGPLRRPRESLVRNFIVVLIKRIVYEPLVEKQLAQCRAAIQATWKMHGEFFQRTLEAKLCTLYRPIPDQKLKQAVAALAAIPDCWAYLDPDIQQRLSTYVRDLPAPDLDDALIELLLHYEPLQLAIKKRIEVATKEELAECVFFETPKEVCDRWINLYLKSRSFDEANDIGRFIIREVSDFSVEQIEGMITASARNGQITGSYRFKALLSTIRERRLIKEDDLDALLIARGLDDFVEKAE